VVDHIDIISGHLNLVGVSQGGICVTDRLPLLIGKSSICIGLVSHVILLQEGPGVSTFGKVEHLVAFALL